MSDIVYVNEQEGLKRCMNKPAFYAKLLNKFIDDTKLDNLIDYAADLDWERAQAEAHTVKGTAGNLALTELFNQALDVETQIKSKSLSPESLDKLKECFSATIDSVREVVSKYG